MLHERAHDRRSVWDGTCCLPRLSYSIRILRFCKQVSPILCMYVHIDWGGRLSQKQPSYYAQAMAKGDVNFAPDMYPCFWHLALATSVAGYTHCVHVCGTLLCCFYVFLLVIVYFVYARQPFSFALSSPLWPQLPSYWKPPASTTREI